MHGVLDSIEKSVTLNAKAELHSTLLVLDVPVGLREMRARCRVQIVRSYDLSVKSCERKRTLRRIGVWKRASFLCVSCEFVNGIIFVQILSHFYCRTWALSSWSQAAFGMGRQLPWNYSETLVLCSMIIAESKSCGITQLKECVLTCHFIIASNSKS